MVRVRLVSIFIQRINVRNHELLNLHIEQAPTRQWGKDIRIGESYLHLRILYPDTVVMGRSRIKKCQVSTISECLIPKRASLGTPKGCPPQKKGMDLRDRSHEILGLQEGRILTEQLDPERTYGRQVSDAEEKGVESFRMTQSPCKLSQKKKLAFVSFNSTLTQSCEIK